MKSIRILPIVVLLLACLTTTAQSQPVVRITEFMADNQHGLDDEDSEEVDWIEIHNAGPGTVNLAGWYLTDTTNNYTKWVFPSVTLAQDAYLIVFASEKDRNVGELHTNFKLNQDGEYLGLIKPDGVTVAFEYAQKFPIQAPDISYGLRGTTATDVILGTGAQAKALVPNDISLEPTVPPGPEVLRPWTLDGLNDSAWTSGITGVGYDVGDLNYAPFLGLNVPAMQNVNETIYIRIPFTVANPAAITSLFLRMRYDDGFIAYINGRAVAWNNSPDPSLATWNSGAPANRDEGAALTPQEFNISAFVDFLHVGVNLLAIQGLNNLAASSDLLILPEIAATVTGTGAEVPRYFPAPTPGGPNNAGIVQLGPIIENEEHHPAIPLDADSVRVTARIRPALGTVSSATLNYRIGYGALLTLPMLDNGSSGDEGIGDGVYGASIPASASGPGQMVRWYITAADTAGGSSRLPVFVEPLDSPEFFGTIVHNPNLTNPLPVLHWFIQTPSAADNGSGTRCSIFYDGEFYDNIGINLHGQSSTGFPKKSYDVDFHPGQNFKWKEGEPRADDINLLTTYPDKAQMRNALSYETFRDAGTAYHWVIPVRVEQNGAFWGTAHIVENGDEDWLVRMGINAAGALYKMYNTFQSQGDTTSGAEKKTRKSENNADLAAFQTGISLTGEARRRYMYDNVDVGEVVDYLAALTVTGNTDCCHKNYYFYRDTGASGEWQMWPWDVDLSYGRIWTGAFTYWDHIMRVDTPLFIGSNNKVPTAIFTTPEMRQMYLRRLRTLMDDLLNPIGTPPQDLRLENRVRELGDMLSVDATLDAARWNSLSWGNGSTAPNYPQTYAQAIADLTDFYLPQRRNQLYNGLASGASEIPPAQPPGTVVNFGSIDYNPASANQEEEYIQLLNPNSFAVDISGWTLAGAIQFQFRGGTVIPAASSVYVAANRVAWRARATAPTGNQALFVTGDYQGRLSARGETLDLFDRKGVKVATINTPANPSPAQSYLRITEIMYHPPVLPGDTFDREEYEYIELKNIGPSQINLQGVRLLDGVIFNFTGSAITTLPASQRVLVVKNTAAFTQRYGAAAAARIAGVYSGNLNNGEERIRLDDQGNEKILEFTYDNDWHPITDGRGFSLVIVDPLADFRTWDLPQSWRPSGHEYGTPAQDDTPLAPVPAILINEVLSHTDLPDKDAIELYNPTTAPVNIGGWFLTDDRSVPKKFVIPAGTSITGGGYVFFDEDDFNPSPGVPPNFSFSSTGDEAYLFSGNAAGELTGYFHGYTFEASATGVPFGRHIDTQGVEHFVAMAARTFPGPNSAPRVGPVVISEINYHPPRKKEGAGTIENREDEYIELQNITGSPVQLYDTDIPANTWVIGGGVDFAFPTGTSIPGNGRLLVVSFDPVNNLVAANAFRARYGLSAGVLMRGPFTGQLANEGDPIYLRRPDSPVVAPDPEAGLIPSIVMDQVRYDDVAPWPVGADGFGPSLQKLVAGSFGGDPINWTAATPSPAAAYPGGNPPVVTVQPASQTVVVATDVTFSVTAAGDPVLRYQWIYQDNALEGKTDRTLLLPNVNPSNQGAYRVLVLNAAGSVVSSDANLTVVVPARITQQPQNTTAHLGGTAIFVVQAASSSPILYQWRKNGAPLNNQTNSFLNIANVSATSAGMYDVVLTTEGVGSITSDPAQLTVLFNPVIVNQPISQNVTVLSTPVNVTFSVVATSGTTLRYQWYFNGAPMSVTPNIPSVTSSSLVINTVNASHSGNYHVVVTDNFGTATSQTATLKVNTTATILLAPGTQAVPEGGTATFSVGWEGSGPFLHRWRRVLPSASTLGFVPTSTALNSLLLANGYIIASPSNTVLVLTNVSLSMSGSTYDIVLSNAVGQTQSADGILTVIADADRDGLPDSWENGRPGFSSADPTDAARDDDHDGIDNAGEYFAGTDYLNDQSYLWVELQSAGPSILSFPAAAGRTYIVQYSDGLFPAHWVNLVIEPARSSDRIVTKTDDAPRPNRFYRLVTPAQP